MFKSPYELYLRAKQVVDEGSQLRKDETDIQELVSVLSNYREGILGVDKHLERAIYIHEKGTQSKLIMEAMLIAPDSSIEKIANTMKADPMMVLSYKKYIFNTDLFEDNFSLLEYLAQLEDGHSRSTKIMGLTSGFYYVVSHFTGGDLNINPVAMNKKMQTLAYNMVMQSRGSDVTSSTAREAKGWTTMLKSSTDFIAKATEHENAQSDFLADFKLLFEKDPELPNVGAIEGEVLRG